MEQELVNLREQVAFLTGAVSDTEKQIDAFNAKVDTLIDLLRDIRDLMARQQAGGASPAR